MFSAHLDTVFPEGTDVKVKREGSMRAPGIGDDCRGPVLLAVARAMVQGNLQTPGTITFVGTVGEEGLGDLRGVSKLFREGLKGRVIVSCRSMAPASASRILRSAACDIESPSKLAATAMARSGWSIQFMRLAARWRRSPDFDVPRDPKTTFNVGRIGGERR